MTSQFLFPIVMFSAAAVIAWIVFWVNAYLNWNWNATFTFIMAFAGPFVLAGVLSLIIQSL